MRASEYEPFINDKKEWISDKYFTQQRLAGVNPMSLRRVTFYGASKGQWSILSSSAGAGAVSSPMGSYYVPKGTCQWSFEKSVEFGSESKFSFLSHAIGKFNSYKLNENKCKKIYILKVVFWENRCNRGICPLTARTRTNKQIDPTRGVNTEMLADEQALRDAMAAGREKEGELATTYVSRIWSPAPIADWLPVRFPPISAEQ